MTYTHLTVDEQAAAVADRVRTLEAQHWRTSLALQELAADPHAPDEASDEHTKDLESLTARLERLRTLFADLTQED